MRKKAFKQGDKRAHVVIPRKSRRRKIGRKALVCQAGTDFCVGLEEGLA
jgi:hypothetical protein